MRYKGEILPETAARPSLPECFCKMAQLEGLDIDKNVIQRVVSGQRFVTDIDMKLCSMMNKGRLWPSFFCSALGSCKHS